jgi:hypothetical protein
MAKPVVRNIAIALLGCALTLTVLIPVGLYTLGLCNIARRPAPSHGDWGCGLGAARDSW